MERFFFLVCLLAVFASQTCAFYLDDTERRNSSYVTIPGKITISSNKKDDIGLRVNQADRIGENTLNSNFAIKFNLKYLFRNFKGKSVEDVRIYLKILYPCTNKTFEERFNSTNSNETDNDWNILTRGNIALDTKCNYLNFHSKNFSILDKLENRVLTQSADKSSCVKEEIFHIELDVYKLLQKRDTCLGADDTVNFILELQNGRGKKSGSPELIHCNLLLETKDASCNFDDGCQWEFDRTALVPSTVMQGDCCKASNSRIQSWLQSNDCVDCRRKFPKKTDQGKLYGWFLPNTDVSRTKMSTHFLLGSSSGCTLKLSVLIFKGDFVVNIKTDSLTRQLYTSPNSSKHWQRVTVPIGRISTAFMLEIDMSLPLNMNLAIDDVALLDCDNADDIDIASCTEDEFRCSTDSCIPRTKLCDLTPDCMFGEDESDSLCDVVPDGARCSFENGWCGWATYDEDSNASKCVFQRTNFSAVVTTNQLGSSHDTVLHLNVEDCGNKGYALLYSPIFEPLTIVNDSCQFRFSVLSNIKHNRPVINLILCQEMEEECHIYTNNDIVTDMPPWKRMSRIINHTLTKRFQAEIEVDCRFTGRWEYLLLDKISFSPGCFAQEDEQNVTSLMSRDIDDVERKEEKSVIVLVLLGAIIGTIVILITALVVVTVYRKRAKAEEMQKPYRKISSHSSSTASTTTSSLEDKIGFPDEALLDNESSDHHSDRQVSLNGSERQLSINSSLCAMTISPYYEWIQEDEMIRNIPRTKIKLLRMIGKGAFGEVYYGLLADVAHLRKELPVAIKTLPSLCSEQTKSEFFFEALILSKFKHPNIVRFLGISVDDRSMFLILELMEGGDVRSFVRDARPREKDQQSSLTIKDLLRLSIDIAKGCQYLECNKFIHRDIAARNCLLTEKGPNRVAKIGDFGMARDILGTNYYRKNGLAMIPVKWMPTEAFMDGVFTSKTDVWAFGVVMWEIFTMGFVPYPGITNNDVMKFVMSGGRLGQPPLASTAIFMLMRDCWKTDPKERPVFSTIVESLNNLLKDVKNNNKINLSDINREVPSPPEPMEKHESKHLHSKNSSHKPKRDHRQHPHQIKT